MEAQLFFTGFVLFICLVHGATTVGKMVGTFFAGSAPAKKNGPSHTILRDDWYVFFHCADLTGTIDPQQDRVTEGQNVAVDSVSAPPKKKGSRPRVYA
jgi:hypothetical protein